MECRVFCIWKDSDGKTVYEVVARNLELDRALEERNKFNKLHPEHSHGVSCERKTRRHGR